MIIIDHNYQITLKDFERVTREKVPVQLSEQSDYIQYINQGQEFIQSAIREHIPIYGVNTGFGDSCRNQFSYEYTKKLQNNLVNFHGCGIGKPFSPEETHGILLLRLISLSKGYSGVRYILLKQFEKYINIPLLPIIPEIGSVGASGDLTPLSYIAATISGKRKVYYQGNITDSDIALAQENIKPIEFEPKEALAILNGTSVMTAISANALIDTIKVTQFMEILTSMTIEILKGNKGSFSKLIHQIKPFYGQVKSAKTISNYLSTSKIARSQVEINHSVQDEQLYSTSNIYLEHSIQDKYSLRCSPQIIGVLWDTIKWFEEWLTIEMNSVNDNPIIDHGNKTIYNGGNFYGGHICQGMDSIRSQLANMSDLLDKQMELIVDNKFNNGLPANLVFSKNGDSFINHGFKAMQISCTAITAEIMSLSYPISILSRPTESLNQDKVSLGTISARYTRNTLELIYYQIAIQLITLSQAMELRGINDFSQCSKDIFHELRKKVPFVDKDRPLDEDIINTLELIKGTSLIDIISKYNQEN